MTSPRLASRPAPAPQRPYVFPEVRRLSVAGGEVVAAHLPGQPLAWLGVMLGGGALAEPAPAAGVPLDGLSRATASLLDEGTEHYTADEFGAAVESLGGHWGVDSGWQSTKVTIDLPVSRAAAGAGLLAEAVRRPAFRETDTRRFLGDLASAKREQFARPGIRAQQALRGALYGEQARYGRLAGGTPESAEALDGELVRAFHAQWLRGPGVLLVAADLDLVDLEALAAEVFADAATGNPSTPNAGAPLPDPTRLAIADRPGAVQSTLRIGHPVLTRTELAASGVDIVALRVASTILGGSFSSRLNQELREVKGYTYGISSGYTMGRERGQFGIRGSVRTDVTGASLVDLWKEIEGMRANPMGAAELGRVRNAQLLSLPGLFDTNLAVVAGYAGNWASGQPLSAITDLPKKYGAVTSASALKAAQQHLDPAQLIVVAVGDKAKVQAQLEAIGRKPEVRSAAE